MFRDRADAGRKLGHALAQYKGQNALVLGIPRGGVLVAYHVASQLSGELSVIVSRKLPFPYNPEAGFGAIAEDGSTFLYEGYAESLSPRVVAEIKAQQRKEAARRVEKFRRGKPLPAIAGRTVILVDDGIAMGSTMRASAMMCRAQKPGRLIVAAPVGPLDAQRRLSDLADDAVIIEQPPDFHAVAQAYLEWYDVPDQEVLDILEQWDKERRKRNDEC